MAPALYGPGGRVPLKPFAGTIGVAPAEPGPHSLVPPRRVGGNMDIRDLAAGTELYLPVEVAGALFSVGDTHAAQGDGEVCGTAIESPMTVALTLRPGQGRQPAIAALHHAGPGHPPSRRQGLRGDDRHRPRPDGRRARRGRAAWSTCSPRRYGMTPVDAYMLCSVCADLRISEIVDMPNWVVSFYFPRIVLE